MALSSATLDSVETGRVGRKDENDKTGDKTKKNVLSPFEYQAPLHFTEKVEMFFGCLLLLPLLRVLASILFAGLGALWCTLIYYLFRCFGAEPAKHPPLIRRLRIKIIQYPMMFLQRMWLFCLGFYWINIKGHEVYCGFWFGKTPKVVVANHTSILDALFLVLQHNPTFLTKRAALNIPFIKTVGLVNEVIAVDRDEIVGNGVKRRSSNIGARLSGLFSSAKTTKHSLTTLDDLQMTENRISKKNSSTKDRIVAHIHDVNSQPLAIFPEGTTCRSKSLIQFKAGGAFASIQNVASKKGVVNNGNGVAIQPLIIDYNKRTMFSLPYSLMNVLCCCFCLEDSFEYANTPETNTKLWALRFLTRFSHSVTLTYLPPVVPDDKNGFKEDPIKFATAVKDSMAQAMGPETFVCEHSYEEFFLFKTLCEELKLKGRVLRSFDFKQTRSLIIQEPFSEQHSEDAKPVSSSIFSSNTGGLSSASTSSTTAVVSSNSLNNTMKNGANIKNKRLTLENVKTMLRAYAKCLAAMPAPPSSSSSSSGVNHETNHVLRECAFISILGESPGKELWALLVKEIDFLVLNGLLNETHYGYNDDGETSLVRQELDFTQFAIALQRTRPKVAYDEVWFL